MTDLFGPYHDPEPPGAGPDRLSTVKRLARARRRRRAVASVGVALVVVAALVTAGTLGRSKEQFSGSCAGGVWHSGFLFVLEDVNRGVFRPDELGAVVGTVARTVECPDRDGDASELPVGTELRAAPGVDPKVGVAAEVDGVVHFFRNAHPPANLAASDALALGEVVEIGLNSTYDGSTRWATISDQVHVAAVVAGIRAAGSPSADLANWSTKGMQTVVEFVRADGLVTQSTYFVDIRVLAVGLAGVVLPATATDAIELALQNAPTAPVRSGLELTGPSGTSPVRDRSACRIDRPDLVVRPNELLQIAGQRSPGDPISFVLVDGPEIDAYSVTREDLAAGIPLPETPGPLVIELASFDAGTSYCAVVVVSG